MQHGTYQVDVRMDETQFLHMGHFLLQKEVHLSLVVVQTMTFILSLFKLNTQSSLDLL